MESNTRVDRHGGLEVGHDLVAEGLVDLLHRLAGRLGEGAQALDHLPALGLGALAPDRERRAEHRHVLAVAGLAVEAGLLEELMAGRDGREGVGLGAETGGEDLLHPPILERASRPRQRTRSRRRPRAPAMSRSLRLSKAHAEARHDQPLRGDRRSTYWPKEPRAMKASAGMPRLDAVASAAGIAAIGPEARGVAVFLAVRRQRGRNSRPSPPAGDARRPPRRR